jgi:uncharacterized protein (DUF2236 family)
MPATRPVPVEELEHVPADDGLFGPDSVTWRVMASPATSIGAAAAVLAQMLHPRVMRMIDQSSNFRTAWDERARLTGEYALTITYGDTATAERAGEVLRRIHDHHKAVDPITGEVYTAGEPDLLLYVHGSLTWALLRAYDRWGPELSPAERDRFVDEQRTAARLVGIDPAVAPASVAELDAYMEGVRPQLAYIIEAKQIRDLVVPPKPPLTPTGLVQRAMSRAAVDLLTPEMQELYGFHWKRLDHAAVSAGTALIMGSAKAKVPYEKVLPELRAMTTTHAFGGAVKRRKADEAAAG